MTLVTPYTQHKVKYWISQGLVGEALYQSFFECNDIIYKQHDYHELKQGYIDKYRKDGHIKFLYPKMDIALNAIGLVLYFFERYSLDISIGMIDIIDIYVIESEIDLRGYLNVYIKFNCRFFKQLSISVKQPNAMVLIQQVDDFSAVTEYDMEFENSICYAKLILEVLGNFAANGGVYVQAKDEV
jgi:hypothetical protein